MGKRWSLFLFLLLVLVSASLPRYHSVEDDSFEGMVPSDPEDDDELEDLEEGFEDAASGDEQLSSVDAVAARKVANVNDQDVERVIASFDYVLLLGYAPWDTQSQELLAEFAAAAVELSRQGNPTVLAKLDAVNNPAAASLYEIRGFPTLLFFTNSLREAYSGGYSRYASLL